MFDPRRLQVLGLVLASMTITLAAPAGAAVKVMFVTSASGSGDLNSWPQADGLSGLAAGDRICQNLASDAGLAHSADFRAWLSTGSTDAFCHIVGSSGKKSANCGQATLPNAGPWVRTDGKPFSHRLQRFISTDVVLYIPSVNEQGDLVADSLVHTGTLSDGTGAPSGYKCNGWSDGSSSVHQVVGHSGSGAIAWTDEVSVDCDASARLLCFESGVGDDLPPFGAPGYDVFITSAAGPGDMAAWAEAGGLGGLAGADQICRTEATAAGFPNPQSFVAWLSSSSTDAIDRLTTSGPWRRPGGVEIAPDEATLTSTAGLDPLLESDIEVDNQGVHQSSLVYTGTLESGHASGSDCADWTSGDPGQSATFGFGVVATSQWTHGIDGTCDRLSHLYCFSNVLSNVVTLFADGFEGDDLAAWSASVL